MRFGNNFGISDNSKCQPERNCFLACIGNPISSENTFPAYCRPFPKSRDKEALEQKIYAASSVVLGPGLGISGHSECIVGAVLAICSRIGKPLILDADGLNILSMHPEWQRLLTENIILTPHFFLFLLLFLPVP